MNTRMFNKNGWVDVDESHARETCQKFPDQWTLAAWLRPDGAPNVNVPPDWQTIQGWRRIELAREIAGPDVNTVIVADEVLRNYLSETRHPTLAMSPENV